MGEDVTGELRRCTPDEGAERFDVWSLPQARAAAEHAVLVISRVRGHALLDPSELDELAVLGHAFHGEAQRLGTGKNPADRQSDGQRYARLLIASSAECHRETAIDNAAFMGTVLTEIAERRIWAVRRNDVEYALTLLREWAADVDRRRLSDG
ncbi:hypothetical protein B5P44_00820 [Mycobacterium sp. CBMA 213]|uniref:Uncharacterized protein n=1 Tax=Mycolicibacterium sp. CBMA 213 TaxID=1968788 RepID=A0A343VRF0_9MYCO|nr:MULTISPECIES: hypothetical protein [unclassified Mycolicibacterium]AVN58474.1 hypothetical protein B5P44_p00179 [Mycolicibacterium sp. CBMA 213]MUL61129.1 hypothetical protein [Mycolicibacterium sp. CBMA 335]MUM03365.1 hypothetical protein [Mycolicibacterium sp. CBMA 213]